MRRGFTLIEILITVAIIILLATSAIPSISNYGQRIAFQNKTSEIESLLNQLEAKAKNPDKEMVWYRIYFDTVSGSLKLMDSSGATLREVKMGNGQAISYPIYPNIYCKVPGTVCGYGNPSIAVASFASTQDRVLTLTDSTQNPVASINFYVNSDSFTFEAR